jgi:hypothetical protein
MTNNAKLYVDESGVYLGAMSGELLPDSPNPYPNGIEVNSPPDSVSDRWDFETAKWIKTETVLGE